MKPILKYRGGKSKEIPQILPYIPNFNGRYIEPFFGGGAMFFHLEHNNAVINDINAPLMNFYRSVQQNFGALSEELAVLKLFIIAIEQFLKHKSNYIQMKRLRMPTNHCIIIYETCTMV